MRWVWFSESQTTKLGRVSSLLCAVLLWGLIVWGGNVWSSGRFLECFTIAMTGVGCHIVRCTCKDELRYSCGERAEPRLRSWDVEQRRMTIRETRYRLSVHDGSVSDAQNVIFACELTFCS